MIIDLSDITPSKRQNYLHYVIAPRPICFASTVDKAGNVNLSPFSFFNLFSTNPPIVIFAPTTRMRDNTHKHTMLNILEVPEVVINIVDYDMVQQMSLASCEFPKGTDEFVKAGFSAEPATLLRPPMVKQSKVKLECKVNEVKSLGAEGGAGNLVICEVLRMHIDDSILDADQRIDQQKLQLVARLGGNWYSRVDSSNLFEVDKPTTAIGIGIDQLPVSLIQSKILTGNNLGQLANISAVPAIDPSFSDDRLKNIFQYYSINPEEMETEIHIYAKQLLADNKISEAWQVLLASS